MTRILLVEDDDAQRLLYREVLEAQGFEVAEARNGREALVTVETVAPDAVILDVNMPGLDGLATLRQLHDRHHRLPVILNSAYAAYRDQYVSWLADAFVAKSSDLGPLVAAVRHVIAERRNLGRR